MLKTRILTAIVLLVGFVADLFLASVDVFALVLSFVAAAAAWEWSRLCGVDSERAQSVFAACIGLLVLIALYIPYDESLMRWMLLAGFLYWASVPITFYLAPVKAPINKIDPLSLTLGVFVILIASVSIQFLRSFADQSSVWLLLYAFALIWIMDTGAYFSGRRFGRNKLAPLISPGKTWEGVYGGLAATAVLLLLVLAMADWAVDNKLKLFVATVLAAAASVLGDLSESRVKRAADVKDSSQLLPGHGGVLDRLDSVLAALPVFAFAWAWL